MYTHNIKFDMVGSGKEFYCYIKVVGNLTHEDYELFVPAFELAIANIAEPKVNILVDITELKGWELEAAWDDLKFALKHGKEFNKISVIGNNTILEFSSKVASWFLPYKVKFFEDYETARDWMKS